MRFIVLISLLALAGCGSCLDPFNKLSDCGTWFPRDHHVADKR